MLLILLLLINLNFFILLNLRNVELTLTITHTHSDYLPCSHEIDYITRALVKLNLINLKCELGYYRVG